MYSYNITEEKKNCKVNFLLYNFIHNEYNILIIECIDGKMIYFEYL